MHINIKNTFLSLSFVSHGTTLGKKPYKNLWYFITYSTILTANLICTLVLGTKIFYSQTNWQNCFGSVDGTVLRILRTKINQSIVYNGHKRAHGIKFQSLPLPNGLIGNISGPYLGKLDMIVPCHTSLGCSRIYRDQYWHDNRPFAFMAIQHTPHCFIFKPHFPDKILQLIQHTTTRQWVKLEFP